MTKRKVVIITDGDEVARRAVEQVGRKVGGRTISLSAGNPTVLSGEEIVQLVKMAPRDPVLIMVDDRGKGRQGPGEKALAYLAGHPEIELLGVVAVASNTWHAKGVSVSCSVSSDGRLVEGAVDKYGHPSGTSRLQGDTVDVLEGLKVPLIIGTGDTGKMDGRDAAGAGAPVTARAVEEILRKSGFKLD